MQKDKKNDVACRFSDGMKIKVFGAVERFEVDVLSLSGIVMVILHV